MWVQKLLLSHKWFLSDSAFILDVPEGIWINIMRMFMNHLIIILEISVLHNTLGFIIKLHDSAFLFNKIYLPHIVLFAFTFLFVSYFLVWNLKKEDKTSVKFWASLYNPKYQTITGSLYFLVPFVLDVSNGMFMIYCCEFQAITINFRLTQTWKYI